MRAPIPSHAGRVHGQPLWLQVGMTVVGGLALGLLIVQVLTSRDHGFVSRPDILFQPPIALHQPVKR